MRTEFEELQVQYDNLKLHLEMYKDQWKRHFEGEVKRVQDQMAREQAAWFSEHLNDEVEDVREELTAELKKVQAGNELLRTALEKVQILKDNCEDGCRLESAEFVATAALAEFNRGTTA